jgi:hypothetical protein
MCDSVMMDIATNAALEERRLARTQPYISRLAAAL